MAVNYPDEDYVRYYTRETVSWRALGWEGQTVLALMLHGRFDRSGVFDCDGHTPSHAVTLVTGLPAEIAERGLERLLAAKTWILTEGRIVWPKFVEAQSCRRTDRARQEESRRNRRDSALAPPGDIGDRPSQTVTRAEPVSPLVTPSRAEPSQAEEENKPSRDSAAVRLVFDCWREVHGHPDAKLVADRRAKIQARLRDGYTPEQLCEAVRAAKLDPFLMGENDRHTVYDDLASLLKSGSKVEKLLKITAPVGRRNGQATLAEKDAEGWS